MTAPCDRRIIGAPKLEALPSMRIGYAPYDLTLARPGDCRRFVYYAKQRGLQFEIADDNEAYDLVVVSAGADLTRWARYNKGPVAYDYVDAYMEVSRRDLKGMFRGIAKYAANQNKYLYLDYWKAIEDLARNSSAVICSTGASQDSMRSFCPNTEVILDFHFGVTRHIKQNYAAGSVFNIVWEGLGGNFHFMRQLSPVLKRIGQKHRLAVHAVTDIEYGAYLGGEFWRRSLLQEARHIFKPCYLHQWNEHTAAAVIAQCDLAVIPIPLSDPMSAAKPANKLMLLWRMGMPVITSTTQAYTREMQGAGVQMMCNSEQEWESMLLKYIGDEEARRLAGTRGRSYVERTYAEEEVLSRWDRILLAAVAKQ